MNELILGDNLEIMKKMPTESIDLIYLDPPFFSNRNYEVIWGDKGEVRSFQDRWAGGVDNYLVWLKARVAEMWRLLKPTGSIFLHCDWHADAYIRVEVLDRIFGYSNFQNSIIWCYRQGGRSKNNYGQKHDTIFWYTKTKDKWAFNADQIRVPYEGTGGYVSTGRNMVNGKEYKVNPLGKIPEDWWDIPALNPMTKERIGYPTQKPKRLIERIIKAHSNEGDIILDPFVGGGTTIIVADELHRQWIGIDQSPIAIRVSDMRLANERPAWSQPYVVRLYKYDYDELRNKEAFDFESFIIGQFEGVSNTKQRNDYGIDGLKNGIPIQVKRSDNIGRIVVDNFKSAIERFDLALYQRCIAENKPAGYIIAFSFNRGAVEEVARLKLKEGILIELVKVEDIVPIAKKPTLKVDIMSQQVITARGNAWELSLTAMGGSSSGIEFYSWDFHHNVERGFNAEIMIDRAGKQKQIYTAGEHTLAVKVVDTYGLENIEVIKIQVNGNVEVM